jgi:hypothetical protein
VQRLVLLVQFEHHVQGPQNAAVLKNAALRAGLPPKTAVAFMADRVAANGVMNVTFRADDQLWIDAQLQRMKQVVARHQAALDRATQAAADVASAAGGATSTAAAVSDAATARRETAAAVAQASAGLKAALSYVARLEEAALLHPFEAGCMSHTISHVGEHFHTPEMDRLLTHVRVMFGKSNEATRLWKEHSVNGQPLASFAGVRWWNEYLQVCQIYGMGLDALLDVARQLRANQLCAESSLKIIRALEDETARGLILMQLAATVDAGKCMVEATFALETDSGGAAFVVHGVLARVVASMDASSPMPTVDAAAQQAVRWLAVAAARPSAAAVATTPSPPVVDDSDEGKAVVVAKASLASAEASVLQLQQRGADEGPVFSVGTTVGGKVVGHPPARQLAVVAAVHAQLDGAVWYDVTNKQTGAAYQACEFELVESVSRRRQAVAAEQAVVARRQQQEARLERLAAAEATMAATKTTLGKAEATLKTSQADATRVTAELVTAADHVAYARGCAAGGYAYFRKRFILGQEPAKGRGQKAVNAGIKAVEAYEGAGQFDPRHMKETADKGGMAAVVAELQKVLQFGFLSPAQVEAAVLELPALLPYVQANSALPEVDVRDERIMQGGSHRKKAAATLRIAARRARGQLAPTAAATVPLLSTPPANVAATTAVADDGGELEALGPQLPEPELTIADVTEKILTAAGSSGTPPILKDLKKTSASTVEQAYAILEWWRLPYSDSSDQARYEMFPAWFFLLRKIALCSPSSAASERVFSMLKACIADQRRSMLADCIEASTLLASNDVDV